MSIIFDCLRPQYIDEVFAIEQACFSDPWSRAQFAEELDNPLARYWIALDDGRVVGYGGLWQVCGDGQITNIAVRPDDCRKGIGRQIIAQMSAYGAQNGLFQLTLEVRESNVPALALYQSCGFERVGRRPGYYADNKEAAILMTKRLGGDAIEDGAGH